MRRLALCQFVWHECIRSQINAIYIERGKLMLPWWRWPLRRPAGRYLGAAGCHKVVRLGTFSCQSRQSHYTSLAREEEHMH